MKCFYYPRDAAISTTSAHRLVPNRYPQHHFGTTSVHHVEHVVKRVRTPRTPRPEQIEAEATTTTTSTTVFVRSATAASAFAPGRHENSWRCYCGLDVPNAQAEAHSRQCSIFELVSDRRLLNLVRRFPPQLVVQRVGEVVQELGGAKFEKAHGKKFAAAEGVAVSALAEEQGDVEQAASKLRESPSYLRSMQLAQTVSETDKLLARLRAAPTKDSPSRKAQLTDATTEEGGGIRETDEDDGVR